MTTQNGKILILPDFILTFLDEGAANIVYKIDFNSLKGRPVSPGPAEREEYGRGTPPPTEIEDQGIIWTEKELAVFKNKLLRLRKDLPTTAPTATAQKLWLQFIAPFFNPDQIINQCLVKLPSSSMIPRFNEQLRKNEKHPSLPRHPMRHGVYLAEDEHGLIVEDMSPGVNQELIQFKPKWLSQSPRAPGGAKRCRQCARAAHLNSLQPPGTPPPPATFCPLDLFGTPSEILICADQILGSGHLQSEVCLLAHWISSTPLLKRLRDLQVSFDTKHDLQNDENNVNLHTAMTLRDCTVFLRFSSDVFRLKPEEVEGKIGELVVDAKLGDLDLKSKRKVEGWMMAERDLIRDGWYAGSEKEEVRQPLTCRLSRGLGR